MKQQQNNMDTYVQDDRAGSDDGTPKVMRAGSEAESARRALRGGGASNDGEQAGVSDHGATEAARTILRAGQQSLENAEAATHAAVDVGERMGGGQVLGEWASCAGRASLRNTQAVVGGLMHCHTFYSLLQWQSNLLNATVADLMDTNARILRLVTHKA